MEFVAVEYSTNGVIVKTYEEVNNSLIRCKIFSYGQEISTEDVKVYPKLMSNAFMYHMRYDTSLCKNDTPGLTVTLSKVDTEVTKTFFYAGKRDVISHINHMNSLTDDQCAAWFKQRDIKKPKKEV